MWPIVGVIVTCVLLTLGIWEGDWRFIASAPVAFIGIPFVGTFFDVLLFDKSD